MGEQIVQVAVKPRGRAARALAVHKKQGSLRVILSVQGTVHTFDGLRRHLHGIDAPVGYRLEL